MEDQGTDLRKTYESPLLRKISPEQAKLILLGLAAHDEGARELLRFFYPQSTEKSD